MQYRKKVKIVNNAGFHLRAVAVFVKVAEKFKADIKVKNDGIEADGKSIMGLTTLGAGKGVEIEIKAEGPDAKEAVAGLMKLIADKFGEAE
jgi:phosphotransferase system HPr (HPr) family protein